jgi:hypothetical protein
MTRPRRCALPPFWRTDAISSTNRLAKSAFMSDQDIASTAPAVAGRWRTGGSSATAGLPSPSRSRSSIAATRARTSGTGTSDPLKPFCGRLGEARANGRGIARAALADRSGIVCRAIGSHQLRRLRLGDRTPARKGLLQSVRSVYLDKRGVVATELGVGHDCPTAWLAIPEPRCATRDHGRSNSCGNVTTWPPARALLSRVRTCARARSDASRAGASREPGPHAISTLRGEGGVDPAARVTTSEEARAAPSPRTTPCHPEQSAPCLGSASRRWRARSYRLPAGAACGAALTGNSRRTAQPDTGRTLGRERLLVCCAISLRSNYPNRGGRSAARNHTARSCIVGRLSSMRAVGGAGVCFVAERGASGTPQRRAGAPYSISVTESTSAEPVACDSCTVLWWTNASRTRER